MGMRKGKLFIKNNEFKPAITAPQPHDIVNPSKQAEINHVKLTTGPDIKNGRCRFVGMSQEIRCLKDVKNGYIKAKQLHPKSHHVICCYRIPGEEFYFLQNCEDDDDWGCSRRILYLMEQNEVEFRAIYVARYYGGKHLGTSRFTSYIEAAKTAVSRCSYNSLAKCNQFLHDQSQTQKKQTQHTKNPRKQLSEEPNITNNDAIPANSTDWGNDMTNPWQNDTDDQRYNFRPRSNSGTSNATANTS